MYTMLATAGQLHTVLLVILCALQVVDLVTTYIALATGRGHEANPLLAPLFTSWGWRFALFFVKFVAVLLILVVNERLGIINGVLVILVLLYGCIVYHNYLVGQD